MRLVFILVCCAFTKMVAAQAMDNTALYNAINSQQFLRVTYDNDFFSAEDRYYTQGMQVGYANAQLNKIPAYRLLISPSEWEHIHSISIEHNAYTPTSLISDTILTGDRPFAAALFLKFTTINIDNTHRQRLATNISTGIIGPVAGGEAIQYNIHKETGNIIPHGWQHQIQNDFVLNYQLNYDKNLTYLKNYLSIDANAVARAGTLSDKLSLGLTITAGYFDDLYRIGDSKKLTIYAYAQPRVNFVGYDATLRGGLFNSSPYTIAAEDISRVTFENRYGLYIRFRKTTLSYFQSYITKEFATANIGKWGGVQLAIKM